MKSIHMIRALLMASICQVSFVSTANSQTAERKQSGLSAVDDSLKRVLQSELGSAPGFEISPEAKGLSGKDPQKRGLMDLPKEVAGGLVTRQLKGLSTGETFRPGAASFSTGFDGIEVKQTESLGQLPQGPRMLSSGVRKRDGADRLSSPPNEGFSLNTDLDSPKKIWKGER